MDPELGSGKRQTEIGRGSGASPHLCWCWRVASSEWSLGGVNRAAADADAELNWRCHHHRPPTSLKYLSPTGQERRSLSLRPRGRGAAAWRLGGWLLTSRGRGQGAATPTGGPPAWSPAHTRLVLARRRPPPKQPVMMGWLGSW